jgi:hypothetical protein
MKEIDERAEQEGQEPRHRERHQHHTPEVERGDEQDEREQHDHRTQLAKRRVAPRAERRFP